LPASARSTPGEHIQSRVTLGLTHQHQMLWAKLCRSIQLKPARAAQDLDQREKGGVLEPLFAQQLGSQNRGRYLIVQRLARDLGLLPIGASSVGLEIGLGQLAGFGHASGEEMLLRAHTRQGVRTGTRRNQTQQPVDRLGIAQIGELGYARGKHVRLIECPTIIGGRDGGGGQNALSKGQDRG
jgi:hypothetical protein